MSRRVSFSPINNKRATPRIKIFKLPKGWSFFRNIGAKVSNALPMISTRRKCSGKVSSSASLGRSSSYAEAHRAEAIEDCIEFFNNPSLQRSNSLNSSC
ncbi:hypothetical protein CASFOL_031987 [Castilleja foliolosa]|uniref:Josephin-like protein n=1 Tax=Castilleja foliolosa TaxID=1961234 RepID=A0ABD3C1X1_9LAMI